MKKVYSPENLFKELAKYYFFNKEIKFNYRPNWLKNSKTGRNLELDVYIPEIKLAFEIQGFHHNWIEQFDKDQIKREKCWENEIKLVEVWRLGKIIHIINKWILPNSNKKDIPDFIKKEIRKVQLKYR